MSHCKFRTQQDLRVVRAMRGDGSGYNRAAAVYDEMEEESSSAQSHEIGVKETHEQARDETISSPAPVSPTSPLLSSSRGEELMRREKSSSGSDHRVPSPSASPTAASRFHAMFERVIISENVHVCQQTPFPMVVHALIVQQLCAHRRDYHAYHANCTH